MKDWKAIENKIKELGKEEPHKIYGALFFFYGYFESQDDPEGYELFQKALGMKNTEWDIHISSNKKLKLNKRGN